MTRWVVVGGGAAGCVIASRLSERPDHEVVLLEAGPDHAPPPAGSDHGPYFADESRLLPGSCVIRRPGADAVEYRQGFGVGGSSLVNMGIADIDVGDREIDHLMPLEAPWDLGVLGRTALAATPDAREVAITRRGGLRVSVADAYLSPVRVRPNLEIAECTRADRVLVDGRRAVGVADHHGAVWRADRVVCCAGAIRTAELLLRSEVDAPGVGAGVQDHPAVAVTLELAAEARSPESTAIPVSVRRDGRQIMVVNHLPDAPDLGALMPGLMRVRSRGRVTVPDPLAPPVVELAQLTHPDDLDLLVRCAAEAFELLEHPTLREVVDAAYIDEFGTLASSVAGDPAAIRSWVVSHLGGYHHVTSSCRIGVTTGSDGGVMGHEGLFVGDASLFPSVPEINPFLPVILQAERLAARWCAPA